MKDTSWTYSGAITSNGMHDKHAVQTPLLGRVVQVTATDGSLG